MTVPLPIRVEVPVCAFRPYASREYQDTYPVPTPASVYGMLLSLLGVPRENKSLHLGTGMALAVSAVPDRTRVFRKLRRGNELNETRPDYQDLLVDLTVWIWLSRGEDAASPPLAERVAVALAHPESISRSGGLSLGESSYLVDTIGVGANIEQPLVFLHPDESGFYSLPVWVDHLDSRGTRLKRFRLSEPLALTDGLPRAWFHIGG